MSHTKSITKRYDLHCHSVHSDGEKNVKELIALAKQAKLTGLSITDHDTISAYPEALLEAKKESLEIVTGSEISCLHGDKPVHLLAYSFSINDEKFKDFIKECQRMRYERNIAMLELFEKHQIVITQDEMEEMFNKKMHAIGRPHFAKLLIERGIASSFSDAFNHYLADGKKCFVLGQRPSVEETIEAIHAANSFAVIAHPHIIRDQGLVKAILGMNFDGIEGYYAKMGPNREQRWIALGNNKNWLITGGSDFHGDCKPINKLGSSWVAEETFKKLKDRFDQNEQLSKS